MVALGFDVFLLGSVLLLLAIVLGGWARGDFERRQAHLITGMFLAFLPMLGGNVATSAGLTGSRLWAVRGLLAAVGLLGLAIVLRGYRMPESNGDGEDGENGAVDAS